MKKPVNIFVLHNLLGGLLSLDDAENQYLMTVDNRDPAVLRALIRQWVVPNFSTYNPASQGIIKDCLAYYLASPANSIERVLPAAQVQIEPPSGRYFFGLVWQELFGSEFSPATVQLESYEEIPGVSLGNSLSKR